MTASDPTSDITAPPETAEIPQCSRLPPRPDVLSSRSGPGTSRSKPARGNPWSLSDHCGPEGLLQGAPDWAKTPHEPRRPLATRTIRDSVLSAVVPPK